MSRAATPNPIPANLPGPGPEAPALNQFLSGLEQFAAGWERVAADMQRLQTTAPTHIVIREVMGGLQAWLHELNQRTVNLQQAAEISGLCERQLRRKIRDGSLKDCGTVGAPRLRLRDLPRK